jgi:hypothetical protein
MKSSCLGRVQFGDARRLVSSCSVAANRQDGAEANQAAFAAKALTALALRRLAHDPQSVLAAVHGLASVRLERHFNLPLRSLELRATAFADAEGRFYDPEISLRHEPSLSHASATSRL